MSYDLRTFRGDLFGGVTSAVVGLPVALAFGVASGLRAIAGVYGAIAVGFFAAVFGGTRSQISGPTGPMAVAMAVIVTSHTASLAEAFTISRHGRPDSDSAGRSEDRPVRGLHAVLGDFRVHVRHRRHHHLAADAALPGAPGAEGGPMGTVRAWPSGSGISTSARSPSPPSRSWSGCSGPTGSRSSCLLLWRR